MLSPAAIADSLARDRSSKNMMLLVGQMQRVGIDLREYVEEIRRQPLPVKWYLTWALSHYVEQNPEAGTREQHLLWEFMQSCDHEGMQRDLWRCLAFMDIGDDLSGVVYTRAIQVITSVKHPIAVRALAMLVAYHIARGYHELLGELDMVLEPLKEDEGKGVRSRSMRIRQWIAKDLMKAIGTTFV